MKEQTQQQEHSYMNVKDTHNSNYSEQTQKREQWEDTPIWIINTNDKIIAAIGEYQIAETESLVEMWGLLNENQINWKLLCTIIAVIADKVYIENKRTETQTIDNQ